ncbi:hypothetical protein [Pseudomonas phage PhL_UNISO_PA-DSM_ph0031]|nr:hypothetical protein [Pseudomonas phage PhL_UNISO_PA-DSM_ph0031]
MLLMKSILLHLFLKQFAGLQTRLILFSLMN